jgi:8-oxo-dGTP diphosphatase
MASTVLRYAAKALIIEDGRLLCLRKRGDIGVYYVLPGGGQEPGELLTATLVRECLEELGARVEPGSLRFVQEYVGRNHLFKDAHGRMHFVNLYFDSRLLERPLTRPLIPDAGQEALEWLPLDRLSDAAFFPRVLADRLNRPLGEGIAYLGDSV